MKDNSKLSSIISILDKKYKDLSQDTSIHLEGLLHSKQLNYWDYINTESLLNLQIQRTDFPDEMVFITYHQINELIFKMILWEISQLAKSKKIDIKLFEEKLMRISRYFDMLTTSFNIMTKGMDPKQYNKFRLSLVPASGFQSYQYRLIEFASTELINLIDFRFRATIDRNTPFEHAFDHLYWQAAGKDYNSGKKSQMLSDFEKKYKEKFITFMKVYNTRNLWSIYKNLSKKNQKNKKLIKAMRHFDYTVNITWVMAHFESAKHFIESSNKKGKSTGGSDWQKYMHPKYQKRIFFPDLWTKDELENWGKEI
tara:strand:+ start:410 stop:1342 length:933 start_codon:yes stop_codon:yes gene_type:complete